MNTTQTTPTPAVKIEQQEDEITNATDAGTLIPTQQETTTRTGTRNPTGDTPTTTAAAPQPGRETRMNSTQGSLLAKPKKKKRPATRRRHSLVVRNPEELESEIRESYFASAGWVALRYEIGVEAVIDHLRRSGLHHASRPSTATQYVEDVVLITAASRGNSRAWHDLEQVFSQPLTRTCTLHLSDQEAVIFVRRFISELRSTTLAAESTRDQGLFTYDGLRPLRVWLVDRLLEQLEQDGPDVRIRLEPDQGTARLRLAD